MRPRFAIVFAFAAALSACGPDWREYRSETGKYTVRFPGTHTIEREHKDGTATVHLVHLEVDKSTAYGVSWFDIANPDKPPAEILVDVQAKVLRDLKAGLSQASEIKLGDAPGRAFSARTGNGLHVSIRLYAVGAGPVRVYQLIAAVPDAGRAESDIRRFFGSFKLLK